ncbi:MAG TPA: hypothetical protein P5228_03660 [Bacteroidales bacterium]|nr:hypothetical protein [Bacteroidales bacterium]HRZ48755.1 hypothetical protein [Bacteroidales bacterium]
MRVSKSFIVVIECLFMIFLLNSAVRQSTGTAPGGSNGKISIEGTTNISSFTLDGSLSGIMIYSGAAPESGSADRTGKFWLRVPAKNFKSSNQQICQDFLELIKAREHPDILIGFSSADIHRICAKPGNHTVAAEVKLAGKVCYYKIRCMVMASTVKKLVITGVQTMKLSDFQITPPQKLFGLIKVNNEILVTFAFNVSFLES